MPYLQFVKNRSEIHGPVILLMVMMATFFSIADNLRHSAETETDKFFSFAHSHNDYENPIPLEDAWDRGFSSVEADIFLIGDKLLVAHELDEVDTKKDFESLYLKPLRKKFKSQQNRIEAFPKPFWLMVDIKSDGESTYLALHTLLKSYSDILTDFTVINSEGKPHYNHVAVVISGNRHYQAISKSLPRLASLDARINDYYPSLQNNVIEKFENCYVAWVSDNWDNHFNWSGDGEIPLKDQTKLNEISKQIHAHGAYLRFWNIPDQPKSWNIMKESGVDLINTDRLSAFQIHFSD